MRYIKKFEELDFSQTLPFTSVSGLTSYYICDDCDELWKDVNHQSDQCTSCHSKNFEEISEDEWYSLVKDEDPDEFWDKERETSNNSMVDLFSLGKNNKKYVD